MFEQSLLLDHAAGKKTGALAASLTVQTLAVGVMIAIPLIYSDRLPDVPRFISLSLPAPPPPLPPSEPTHVNSARSSRSSLAPVKVFIAAPRHIPDLSQIPDIGIADAPPAYAQAYDGVPGGTGIAPVIGQLFRDTFTPSKPAVPEPAKVPAKPTCGRRRCASREAAEESDPRLSAASQAGTGLRHRTTSRSHCKRRHHSAIASGRADILYW